MDVGMVFETFKAESLFTIDGFAIIDDIIVGMQETALLMN